MKNFFIFIVLIAIRQQVFSQLPSENINLEGNKTKQAKATILKADSIHSSYQAKIDTLQIPNDSIARTALHKVDSIKSNFQTKADSIQKAYQKPLNKLSETSSRLQHKIDSLQKLKLPTTSLTTKLDSINNLSKQKITELSQKVTQLKNKSTEGLKKLNLPPEMNTHVEKLQQIMGAYNIPVINGKIPNVLPSLGLGQSPVSGIQLLNGINSLPAGSTSIPGTGGAGGLNQMNLPGTSTNTNQLTDLTKEINAPIQQLGSYGKEIQNVSKGELPETKNLEKSAENELKNRSEVKELTGKTGEFDKYKKQLNTRPDSAMISSAKQELKNEAINHFAGKEEVLKGAMDKMTKLKSRYSEVKSIADLPKRMPNPLKGKPLIERLVPAFTLQFINSKNVLLDFNPSLAYKIYPRWKAGLGWTERITFDNWKPTVPERVYGIRTYNEVLLPRGFNVRGDVELLNAKIPPLILSQPDDGKRDWEWNIIVGLKKEFKIYKSINGNVQTMYRIWSNYDKTPYPDRLIVRMGFEFPMKKRKKK